MANLDAKKGFWPIRTLNGDNTFAANPYYMTANTTIYKGDAVHMLNTGLVQSAAASSTANVVGVAAETITSPASSTSTQIMVHDNPHQVFGVQTVSSVSFAQSMVGIHARLTATAGSATTGLSQHELNIGTLSASVSASHAQAKILRLIPRSDNAVGEHADVEVVFNKHLWDPSAKGI